LQDQLFREGQRMAGAPQPAANDSWQAAAASVVDLPALVKEHHAAVYRYACRLCGCPAEAEDLTQQTFLIAHQKLHQLRDTACATAWLLAITRRAFLKSVRRPRPTPTSDVELLASEAVAVAANSGPIDQERLTAALHELPDEFRLVLLMYYFEDLSYQQMAEQLEIPIGTVMSRLSRAKGHLRARLEDAESARHVPSRHERPARRKATNQATST
jgi:RNA polymerase sigma-70 factor (ECF subfamily)